MNVLNYWEDKCWGRVAHLSSQKALVSILEVDAGWRCSRHFHKKRINHFRVISGSIRICCFALDDRIVNLDNITDPKELSDKLTLYTSKILGPGSSYTCMFGSIHCFEVIESGTVVETYWNFDGTTPDINDIVRFDEGCRI